MAPRVYYSYPFALLDIVVVDVALKDVTLLMFVAGGVVISSSSIFSFSRSPSLCRWIFFLPLSMRSFQCATILPQQLRL